jgi:hypothetical protein
MRKFLLTFLLAVGLFGQTTGPTYNQGNLSNTVRFRKGTVVPSSCQVNDLFMKTDAPMPANLYICPNGLTFIQAAAAGLAGGDLSGSYPNPTVATVGGKSAAAIADTINFAVMTTASYTDPDWLNISKTKIGLANVENTALSTWAGSANINTIGTLSSGTVPWARLSDVPTFASTSHTHPIGDLSTVGDWSSKITSGTYGINVTGSAGTVPWTGVASRPTALSGFTNDLGFFPYTGRSVTVDVNTITTNGFWAMNGTNPNRPGDFGTVLSMVSNDVYTQIYGDHQGPLKWRGTYASTWVNGTPWRTIIDSNNIGSQSVAHAVDADAVPWTGVSGKPGTFNPSAHTHPITDLSTVGDYSSKITSGTYSINVTGSAGSAGSVPWTGVSSRPTALSQFTNDSGFQTSGGSVNYANSAGSANSVAWSNVGSKPA